MAYSVGNLDLSVTFKGDVGDLQGKLGQAAAGIDGFADGATSDFARVNAASQGVNKAFAGMANNVQLSTKQMQFALRGVPAQFTDIITSLQGGQAPLTVLLQQGGQLKDMFGGVGNAAKALGGYVVGLINPLTLAAAAAGAVAVAYYQGSQEADEFRKQLLLTGNAAGTSTDQLMGMAAQMDVAFGVTQGKAAEALAMMAGTGQVAAGSLQGFAQTAIDAEKSFGVSMDTTAKNFASLGKDPVGASQKLTETMNYLTAATFEQIKAAADLGNQQQAAAIAQGAYDAALKKATDNAKENLGYLQIAWGGVGAAAKESWDWMLGVGREESVDEKIKKLTASLAQSEKLQKSGSDPYGADFRKSQIDWLKQQIEGYSELTRIQKRAGDAEAGRVAVQNAGITATLAVSQANEKAMSKTEQMNKALGDYAKKIGDIRAANPESALLDPAQIAKTEASIRGQFKEAAKGPSIYKSLSDEIARFTENVEAQIASDTKLTEGEKLALKVGQARTDVTKALTAAQAQQLEQSMALALEKEQDKTAKEQKDALLGSMEKELLSLNQQIEKQAEHNAAIGLSKDAVAALAAVKLDDAAATKDQLAATFETIDLSGTMSAMYREEARALRELADLKRVGGVKEATHEADKKATDDFDKLIGNVDASRLNGMFNGATDGAMKFITALNLVADVSGKTQAALSANDRINATDLAKHAKEQTRITKLSEMQTISAYGSMAGAMKGYAKEGSRMYSALHNAERVFRAFELASAISNMATKSGLLAMFTTSKVAADATMTASGTTAAAADVSATMAVGQAKALSGIANQAQGDPYSAFPRMAAMAAIMAGLGFLAGGFGGGGSQAAPTNNGTGTVLGDSGAQSESLANSLDILNATQDSALSYSKRMADSLRTIEGSIGSFANIYMRTGGTSSLTDTIQTGRFDTALSNNMNKSIDFVFNGGILTPFIPAFQSLTSKLFGGTSSITGSGISAGKQSLSQIEGQGFQGNYYADVETKKKFSGVTYSTKSSTLLSALDATLEQQISAVFKGVSDSVGTAADFLELDTKATNERLQQYIVDIGRVNLAGLTGEKLTEKLSAVFGAESDKIAASVIPGFEGLQKVGEGYFETLTRMANQFELVGVYMRRMGDSLGATGVEGAKAADSLVSIMGGLKEFNTAIDDFYNNFYTDAERNAAKSKELGTAMADLGFAMPATVSEFKDLVLAQDLSTLAGREAYASLINLSSGFKDVSDAAQASADAAQASADAALEAAQDSYKATLDLYESLQSAAQKNTDAALSALDRAATAEKKIVQARIDAAQESVSTIKSIFDLLKTNVAELYASVSSTSLQSAAEGRSFISNALSNAQSTGYLPELAGLQTAIKSVRDGFASTSYASKFEAERDKLVLAGQLGQLKNISGDQLTESERMLSVAKDQLKGIDEQVSMARTQIDVMRGVDTSVLSVVDAVHALSVAMQRETKLAGEQWQDVNGQKLWQSSGGAVGQATATGYTINTKDGQQITDQVAVSWVNEQVKNNNQMGVYTTALQKGISANSLDAMMGWAAGTSDDWAKANGLPAFAAGGMHSGGLRMVGELGPEIEATGPARYYSHQQTKALLSGGDVGSGNTEELRALRTELAAQSRAMVQMQLRLTKLMERWDADGMPETRSVAA